MSASVEAGPYDLAASSGEQRNAALCLHGLTGTPYEVRPIAEALAVAGLRARGPALPGHHSTPEDCAAAPFGSWLAAARDECALLRRDHEHVIGVGLSMGGLATLAMAAEGHYDAIVVIGTPLRLKPPIPQLVPLLKYVKPYLRKSTGSDIREAGARARHPSYDVMPLAAVHELCKLQARVRGSLARVLVPTFIAHGARDETADPEDAERIRSAIASDVVELRLYGDSGHVVPVDYDGETLCADVVAFVERVLSRL